MASSRVESLELYLLPDGLRFLYKLSQQSKNIHFEYWDVYLNLHSLLLGPSPKQVETVQLPDCRTVPGKKLFLLGLQAPKQEKGSSTALYQYQYQYQCTITLYLQSRIVINHVSDTYSISEYAYWTLDRIVSLKT